MADAALADRVAAAYADVLLLYAGRVSGRSTTVVAGLPVTVLGVPEPWGTTVLALRERPAAADVAAAVSWCEARSAAYCVLLRERDEEVAAALPVRDELPAFVLDLTRAPSVAAVAGVQAGLAGSAEEFCAVYGRAFAMRPGLAQALVDEADLGVDGLVHLVAREGERAVACALLRLAAGVGYISAVGTAPGERGRGIATFLTRFAAAEARRRGADLALLHAARGRTGLYEGMGFELADTHVSRAVAG